MRSLTGIIDYGVGNPGSVRNMLMRSGCRGELLSSAEGLANVDRVILPGIGHFGHAMTLLSDAGWIDPIKAFAASGKPLLGICLGMQLLTDFSEEGDREGLSLIQGTVRYFDRAAMEAPLPVPHMGWSHLEYDSGCPLFAQMTPQSRFYFVHSLHVEMDADAANGEVISRTHYGYPFVSGIRNGNVFGVQFHPEKSHVFGSQLLRSFCALT